jgi:regulatory protein
MNSSKNMTNSALLDRARRYCALAEQCESGVRQKLVTWGAGADEANGVVDRLRAEGYLDDKRYARAYCESKILQQGWGRQKVLYQLRLKHLPKDAIDAAMGSVDEEAYLGVLASVAERKKQELGGDGPEQQRKLMSFLTSRGFTFGEINKVITNTLEQ